MKTLIKTLFAAITLLIFAAGARGDENHDAAVAVAKAWLAWVDAMDYKKSWQEAAPLFKDRVKEQQWTEMITAVRKPLGEVVSRELISAESKTSLPGVPDGDYVVIQFKTSFAAKRESVETINPMRVDGTWRVGGYFIR
jgi:hypothetical protein